MSETKPEQAGLQVGLMSPVLGRNGDDLLVVSIFVSIGGTGSRTGRPKFSPKQRIPDLHRTFTVENGKAAIPTELVRDT